MLTSHYPATMKKKCACVCECVWIHIQYRHTSKACTGMALLLRMERGGREQGEDKLMSWRALRACGDREKQKSKKKELEKK